MCQKKFLLSMRHSHNQPLFFHEIIKIGALYFSANVFLLIELFLFLLLGENKNQTKEIDDIL